MVQTDLVILTSKPTVRAHKCSKSSRSEAQHLRRGGEWHEDMWALEGKPNLLFVFFKTKRRNVIWGVSRF